MGRVGKEEGHGDKPPAQEASSRGCHLHLLIYSKNNSGRAADATNGGAVKKREAGRRAGLVC